MQKKAEILVRMLKKQNKHLAVMESCTGGSVSNEITNIEGASEVFTLGAVTYTNEQKVNMGVEENVIDKYSVYSIQTANQMALAIAKFANADIGVGVTGKLKRADINNDASEDDQVLISVYNYNTQQYLTTLMQVDKETREENKQMVVDKVFDMVFAMLLTSN